MTQTDDNLDNELTQLISQYLDGTLTEAESQRLHALVESNEVNLSQLIDEITLSHELKALDQTENEQLNAFSQSVIASLKTAQLAAPHLAAVHHASVHHAHPKELDKAPFRPTFIRTAIAAMLLLSAGIGIGLQVKPEQQPKDQDVTTISTDQQVPAPVAENQLVIAPQDEMLRLQFDCGQRYGVYRGKESPAFRAKMLTKHDIHYNPLYGDMSGHFIQMNGYLSPVPLSIDVGARPTLDGPIDWSLTTDEKQGGPQGHARGIFASQLGMDGLHHVGGIALKIEGLPKGKYQLFILGRSGAIRESADHLKDRAYRVSVQTGDRQPQVTDLLGRKNSNGARWLHGHTHAEVTVEVENPSTPLIIQSQPLKQYSVDAGGLRGIILGFQIIQIQD